MLQTKSELITSSSNNSEDGDKILNDIENGVAVKDDNKVSEEDIKEKDLNEQKEAEEESLDAKIEREALKAENKAMEETEEEEEKPRKNA